MSMSIMSTLFIFGASRALIAPAVLAACLLSGVPAGAQPIFPPGSRIGLEPPAGMTPSLSGCGIARGACELCGARDSVGCREACAPALWVRRSRGLPAAAGPSRRHGAPDLWAARHRDRGRAAVPLGADAGRRGAAAGGPRQL